MTGSKSLLNLAHEIVQERLASGAIAIDATIGNGHDTLCLARLAAPFGMVYGFDIQIGALTMTRKRLQDANLIGNVNLILDSHANLAMHVAPEHHGQISVIMFNLGYLPGSDKSVITQSGSTLAALDSALELLAPAGLITIIAYPGHRGGGSETRAVQNWCAQLDAQQFQSTTHKSRSPNHLTPILLVIEKKSV